MKKPKAGKDRDVKIRKGQGKPEAHPEEVKVPSDGKVTWTLDANAGDWIVLMDGPTPFVGNRTRFSGNGQGTSAGARIDTNSVEDGDEFKYWVFWRDPNGVVQYDDPRIVIDDLP